MPIMALFRSPRVDQNLYDAIIQDLDLEQAPAAGALTHSCGFDNNGICVVDVWETRGHFEAFLADRLRPTFAKLNIEFVEPVIIDAYAFTATEDVDQYVRERAAGFQAAGKAAATDERPAGPAH